MKVNVNKNKASLKSRKASKYRSHWHCVYHLKYHLVLVTKYRKKCLNKALQTRLHDIFIHICALWDVELIEFGADSDHVHLLLDFHPSLEPAKFIGNLKTVSSRLLRKEFSAHLAEYYWKPLLWSRAYCLISVGGAPLDMLKRYVQEQGMDKE